MKEVLIIGSGLAGITCALELASQGVCSTLVSPYPSERAQSVMAAGGINAAMMPDDSVAQHMEDTLRGGCEIADREAIRELCEDAPAIVRFLDSVGTVFSRDENDALASRFMGGHSQKRTFYAGSSTGKQIMTALIRESRKYESDGVIKRKFGLYFHSALIENGMVFGALLYNDHKQRIEEYPADAVVIATGGQNALFGKNTGSALCDGYAAAKLFEQGVTLKNLEFIQYHPTTIETPHKRMLITEAARGEGGRLYYLKDGKRVYFMEDAYGEKGNLMPRDVVSRHIYEAPSQVYLDIAYLGKELIYSRLAEIAELCQRYLGLDVTKESIPISPSVHYFMGGIAVDRRHRTNIDRLYAIGECASIYHGANRLGGNSLLGAMHSARVAANSIASLDENEMMGNFDAYISAEKEKLERQLTSQSPFSAMYIRYDIARLMSDCLGICRSAERMEEGIRGIDYYLSISDKLSYDSDVSPYLAYSLKPLLILARAILTSALARKESRGAHYRKDYPEKSDSYRCAGFMQYDDGAYHISFKEDC